MLVAAQCCTKLRCPCASIWLQLIGSLRHQPFGVDVIWRDDQMCRCSRLTVAEVDFLCDSSIICLAFCVSDRILGDSRRL